MLSTYGRNNRIHIHFRMIGAIYSFASNVPHIHARHLHQKRFMSNIACLASVRSSASFVFGDFECFPESIVVRISGVKKQVERETDEFTFRDYNHIHICIHIYIYTYINCYLCMCILVGCSTDFESGSIQCLYIKTPSIV